MTGKQPTINSGKHDPVNATALPGSHSSVPCAPKDMKPVLDRKILEIAQPSVDAPQCIVGSIIGLHARFDRKPGPLGLFQDQSREPLPPAPIKAVCLRVFVDKPLELAGVSR